MEAQAYPLPERKEISKGRSPGRKGEIVQVNAAVCREASAHLQPVAGCSSGERYSHLTCTAYCSAKVHTCLWVSA